MHKNLTPDEIIDALGGTSAVARECEIQPPSVSEWRKKGIPKPQLRALRLAHPEVFDKLEAEQPPTDPSQEPDRGRRKPINVERMMTISKPE